MTTNDYPLTNDETLFFHGGVTTRIGFVKPESDGFYTLGELYVGRRIEHVTPACVYVIEIRNERVEINRIPPGQPPFIRSIPLLDWLVELNTVGNDLRLVVNS